MLLSKIVNNKCLHVNVRDVIILFSLPPKLGYIQGMTVIVEKIQVDKPAASIEDAIILSVLDAVSEQRLPAGSKLGEQALSDLFDCNRANVRRALTALAHQRRLLPQQLLVLGLDRRRERGRHRLAGQLRLAGPL